MKLLTALPFLTYLSKTYAGDVLSLGASDFGPTVENTDLSLVKFYAPWCGHCKKIAPEFEKAATQLKKNDPPVTLIEVDCTEHQSVCGKYGVSGYPTLKIFRNGEASDYQGGRQASDMVKIMAAQAGPVSLEILDEAKLAKVQDSHFTTIYGFFSSENDEAAKNFNKVANEYQETLDFVHSYNSDIAEKAGFAQGDIVILRPKVMKSKFEDQEIKFPESETASVEALRTFIEVNQAGLAPVIEMDTLHLMLQGKAVVLAVFDVDYERNPKGTQYWRNRVMKVAKDFPDFQFACANFVDFARIVTDMGIEKPHDNSPIIFQLHGDQSKYVMTETFDPKGVAFTQFLNDLQSGKIEKHIKSEGDQDNEGKANKVLTARNYEQEVDGSKDAFIEFYAPWCGHCKSLAPKWEEMAEKMQKANAELVVGKFDATANDVPSQFEVRGFPTIYWVPKGGSPVKYEGGREVKDLVNYAKKHASSGKDEL